MPVKKHFNIDTSHTIIPDGIEKAPKRYAICYRNRWMLDRSDAVIGFVNKSYGGAAQFFELAIRMNKHCINLCDLL